LFGKKYSILCLAMLVFAAALNGCTKQENGMTFWQPVPETSNAEAETEVIREHQISSSLVNEGMDIMEATQAFPYADAEDSSSSEKDETTIFAELPELGPLSGVKSTDFVNVQWYIPQVQVELRYSQTNNFTGEIIYNFQDAYLRYGTVSKLLKVCEELEKQGLYLKIWDAFRPASAQFALWEICPDPQYVANPNRGYSYTHGEILWMLHLWMHTAMNFPCQVDMMILRMQQTGNICIVLRKPAGMHFFWKKPWRNTDFKDIGENGGIFPM